ncbi:hypothetical protein JCM9279_004548 [Rhodotorula babjevae]
MRSRPISPSSTTSPKGPASHGMVRKRTLQDAQPQTPGMRFPQSSPESRSPRTQAFQFDSSPRTDGGLLSSPATLYSSPMARSASAQASFSPYSPYGAATLGSLGQLDDDDDDLAPEVKPRRPRIKRRRTLADAGLPTPPGDVKHNVVSSNPRTGFGKDGEDVWPTEINDAFHSALRLLPRLGRKKLIIEGKAKGRNELIGDYILRTTGKERSRKQISSHLQCLKHQLSLDPEFMHFAKEPEEGEDRFEGNNAALFFGENSPYARLGPPTTASAKPKIDISAAASLGPFSSIEQPLSALHSPFVMHPAHGVATPTTQLANAFETMTVLPAAVPPSCPFLPTDLSMWATPRESSARPHGHVFARLPLGAEPTGKTFVEDLPGGLKRYPMLPDMIERQPCQFLHLKLNLHVPTAVESSGLADAINTHLALHSLQELNLQVITSFCHDGVLGAQFIDPLSGPYRLAADAAPSISPSSRSPLARSFRHSCAYNVPFSPHWWTAYLDEDPLKQHEASSPRHPAAASAFARSGKSRFELQESLKGISILQEFFVSFDESAPLPHPTSGSALRGSDLGDVVLVVAYDVGLSEGAQKGSAELSFLSTRRSLSPQGPRAAERAMQPPHLAPAGLAPPMVRSATSPARMAHPPSSSYQHQELDSMLPPPLPRHPSHTAPSRHQAPHHPNLSLRIPSPTQFVRRDSLGVPGAATATPLGSATTPHTPWGQIAHTPLAPPPIVQHDADDERLQHIWLQSSTAYDLHSPALMGLSQPPPQLPYAAPTREPNPFEDEAFASFPLESAAAVAGVAPPHDVHIDVAALEGAFDEACFAPSSSSAPYHLDGELLPQPYPVNPGADGLPAFPPSALALNALTASAAALPTPSFATTTFDPALFGDGSDLFSMPPPPLPIPALQPPPPAHHRPTRRESMPTPQLVPQAMSASSSSSGSSSAASVQSADDAVASAARMVAPRAPAVGGDPVKGGAKKATGSAKKANEQAFFSSLFGPTKYAP